MGVEMPDFEYEVRGGWGLWGNEEYDGGEIS